MIAITGAAGFIGSNLAHRLAKMGQHLFLIDHPFSVAKAANWAGLPRFCFVTDAMFMDALRSRNLPIEATLAVPLIVGFAYHRGAWKDREFRHWNSLLGSVPVRAGVRQTALGQ